MDEAAGTGSVAGIGSGFPAGISSGSGSVVGSGFLADVGVGSGVRMTSGWMDPRTRRVGMEVEM